MGETLISPFGLPDAETVNENLLAYYQYDPETSDFERIKHCLDMAGPIQLFYTPTVTPRFGFAPEHIRQQWVGLRLPVRSKELTEEFGEGFVVRSREALEILKVERPEAHEWWRNHYIGTRKEANATRLKEYEEARGEPWPYDYSPIPENPEFPEYGTNMCWFIFSPDEGLAIPVPAYRESLLTNEPLLAKASQRPQ